MADINQLITFGIGTPSDIEHFILFGLNGQALSTPTVRAWTLPARDTTWTIETRDTAWATHARDTNWTVEER